MNNGVGKDDRIYRDMETMIDKKYNDKYFVHRVIRFLRDHPERAPDYIDFVPDWKTRDLDKNLRDIEAVHERWKNET